MTLEDVKTHYIAVIENERKNVQRLKNQIFKVGTLRLIVVLGGIAAIYMAWGDTKIVVSILAVTLIAFLFLLKYHNRLFLKRKESELHLKNAENELKAINYDFSGFDGAAEMNNNAHSFSLDLDIFGNNSFFQSLNRTSTWYGKERLCQTILQPNESKEEIEGRQRAIGELSRKVDLLSDFKVAGQMHETNTLDIENFVNQFEDAKPYSKSGWRFAPYISIISVIAATLLYALGVIDGSLLPMLYTLLMVVGLIPMKPSMKRVSILDKKVDSLETYAHLFRIIENQKFESDYLTNLQNRLKGDTRPSVSIAQLKSYGENLFQSFTVLGVLILNPLMMWNIFYNIRIERWIEKNGSLLPDWFAAVGEFDSLVSFATFAYNHPDYTYPKVSDSYRFEAKNLGHPMINREVCVRNDVNIAKHPFFLVVTGANMAGKSTYLRTVGLNLVLACTGAPVCASEMSFFPFRLVTNLRTSDSLADNESYFFAELKRLKMIIDRLQSGERLFIILDEILKGTNSGDKQKGSIALMRQLVSLNANGIIATHDLILGNLEKEYPEAIKNYRFEADIKDEHLSFSYKIREGVAQNMNACFLMKKMGITGL